MIVGVTGGIGSGKSTVTKLFQEFKDVSVYIADDEAKKISNTSLVVKQKLIEEFGEQAYVKGLLNRAFIADIVFNNPKKLAFLNSVIHPEVAKHFKEFVLKNNDKSYIVYESAILFESGGFKNCDFVITVIAPIEVCVNRVIKRDKTTREHVLNRINNQWSTSKKSIQSNYVIENISLQNTQKSVRNIHNILTKKQL